MKLDLSSNPDGPSLAAPHQAPYGTWSSPLTAQQVAREGGSSRGILSSLQVSNKRVYWRALVGTSSPRYDLMTLGGEGQPQGLLPLGFSARSRVHEYGGGEYFLGVESLFFVNDHDQRLYRMESDLPPIPLTPDPPVPQSVRYADGRVHPAEDWIAIVQETHQPHSPTTNRLVGLKSDGPAIPQTLRSDHDFFSSPRFSPMGDMLCWLTWDHPRMPWDGTDLWAAPVLGPMQLGDPVHVAGGRQESVFQPQWAPDGSLAFVSDRNGWWNLYRWRAGRVEPVLVLEAELGEPAWAFDLSRYAHLDNGNIAVIYTQDGIDRLGVIHEAGAELEPLETPFTAFYPASLRGNGEDSLWFIASSPSRSQALYEMQLGEDGGIVRLFPAEAEGPATSSISRPQAISAPGGAEFNAHAFFYPPSSRDFSAPKDDTPPLIVTMHGGPTGRAVAQLRLETQFWTSRGFGVADVNYRGSSGFGRTFRTRLDGLWGEADVEDCVSVAQALANSGLVDPERMVIRGSSAGGFSAFAALVSYEIFAAAALYYPVSDLASMVGDTNRFESHYVERLIGPFPESKDTYMERSPLHNAHRLRTPVIIFQGLQDPIIPPSQTRRLIASLSQRGIPHAYLEFPGEGHGFRDPEHVARALEAELAFYCQILQIPLPPDLPEVEIHPKPQSPA